MSRVVEHGNAILDSVCESTEALGAEVRDASSPTVWWQSATSRHRVTVAILDELSDLARAEATEHPLHEGGLLRLCRHDQAPHGCAFSFAGIYLLLVGFAEPFNRFVVEPHVRRALPLLEQLVPKLPPVDDGGEVLGFAKARLQKPPKK